MKHIISQVDGVTDIEDEDTFKELNSQVKVKVQETQTDVFLKVDRKGDLNEPFLDLLYDHPPATVYHPAWGVGKYHSTDPYTQNKMARKTQSYEFEGGVLNDV